jgi:hypothetical protein
MESDERSPAHATTIVLTFSLFITNSFQLYPSSASDRSSAHGPFEAPPSDLGGEASITANAEFP